MKYKILYILSVAVLYLLTYTNPAIAVSSVQCGDCNGDGFINNLDTDAIQNFIGGSSSLDYPYFDACNLSGTRGGTYALGATVDNEDLNTLEQYLNGQIADIYCILESKILFRRYDSTVGTPPYPAIVSMNRDGSNQQNILVSLQRPYTVSNPNNPENPKPTPDGSQYMIGAYDYSLPGSPGYRPDVFIANFDGTFTNLFSSTGIGEGYPSPTNGGIYAFASNLTSPGGIYLGDINQPGTYVSFVIQGGAPDVARSQSKIVYIKTVLVGGFTATRIYMVDFNGQNDHELAPNLAIVANQAFPDWSYDEKMIVFSQANSPGPGWDIFMVSANPSGPGQVIQVTNTPNFNEVHPSFSRDGRKIYYSAEPIGGTAFDDDIFEIVLDPATFPLTQPGVNLTNTPNTEDYFPQQ